MRGVRSVREGGETGSWQVLDGCRTWFKYFVAINILFELFSVHGRRISLKHCTIVIGIKWFRALMGTLARLKKFDILWFCKLHTYIRVGRGLYIRVSRPYKKPTRVRLLYNISHPPRYSMLSNPRYSLIMRPQPSTPSSILVHGAIIESIYLNVLALDLRLKKRRELFWHEA